MMAAVDGVKEGVTKKGLLVTLKCLSSKDCFERLDPS